MEMCDHKAQPQCLGGNQKRHIRTNTSHQLSSIVSGLFCSHRASAPCKPQCNTFKQKSSTAMWEPDKVMQKTIPSSYCPLKVVLQPTESWCLLSFLQDYIKSFFFTWLYLLWLREATNNKQEMTCSRKSEQKLMKRSSVTLLYSK